MPRIYHSGGDVMLEGYGRLDSDAQAHLADVTKDEFFSAIKAKNIPVFNAAKARQSALREAQKLARQWQRASA